MIQIFEIALVGRGSELFVVPLNFFHNIRFLSLSSPTNSAQLHRLQLFHSDSLVDLP